MDELIKSLLSGSQEGWNEFLDRYSRLVYKVFFAKSFGFSREEIDELFNDFIVNLMRDDFRKIRQFEGRNQCSFASYLKKIAINMAIDRRKKIVRSRMSSLNASWEVRSSGDEQQLLELLDSGVEDPDEILIDREETTQFQSTLYRLDPLKLLTVLLIVYHEFDREDLGRLLKKTRQNIDVIYNRSKEQLKKLLREVQKTKECRKPAPWSAKILRYKEKMVLGDRDLMFQQCMKMLSAPNELLVGVVFLNSPALDPTPERMGILLKCDESEMQHAVESALNKVMQQ